jgi:hypothetical protein
MPPQERRTIFERCENVETEDQVAADYGVTQRTVSKIVTREAVQEKRLSENWTAREKRLRAEMERGLAVVVNLRTDVRLIAWARDRGLFVKIDRHPEPPGALNWGNPFVIDDDGNRDEVCDLYEQYYFPHKRRLNECLSQLAGKALGCWCAPQRCHGDHLAKLANRGRHGR